jgi:single-stranded-DNA-specific exonuclease
VGVGWGSRKRWVVAAPVASTLARLQTELGVSALLARLLVNRKFTEPEPASAFLDARLSQHLRSPLLFRDMERAADRILEALQTGERIGIYADYDVDGVSGSAILIRFLRELGAEPVLYIPNRLVEGYGLNEGGIRRMSENGVRLLLTVDCGGVSHRELALAASLGMDAIVCDHHETADTPLPALAVLNPADPGAGFPFRGLCGAGVAFYLALGVRMRLREQTGNPGPDVRRFLDLVALGTVADVVPLIEENRVLVKYGIRELQRSARPGVVALKRVSAVTEVTTGAIGFRLAPRLNAGGRLADAFKAVDLLTTEDPTRAEELAAVLEEENRTRQKIEKQILDEAVAMVEAAGGVAQRCSIVLASDGWHPGVIGIVASRLVGRYCRPTILVAVDRDRGVGRGSARSIPGLDVHDAIRACRDTLEAFGGHKMAAGLRVRSEATGEFAVRFEKAVSERTTAEAFVPTVRVDGELSFRDVDTQCIEDLQRLEPTGPSNARPVFATRGVRVRDRRVVASSHLKIYLDHAGQVLPGIAFGMADLPVESGQSLDVLYTPMVSEWNGASAIELRIQDLRPSRAVT